MNDLDTIHGLRLLCRNTVEVFPGEGGPILVHDSLEEERSDFEVLFAPLFEQWRDGFVVNSFFRSVDRQGELEDPADDLAVSYDNPEAVHSYDAKVGLVVLHGKSLPGWAPYCGGYWWQLLVLDDILPFAELARWYYGGAEGLGAKAWPRPLRCVLTEWDDTFWQIFARDAALIEQLKEVHRQDPRIRMFEADIRKEYPNPSGDVLVEMD